MINVYCCVSCSSQIRFLSIDLANYWYFASEKLHWPSSILSCVVAKWLINASVLEVEKQVVSGWDLGMDWQFLGLRLQQSSLKCCKLIPLVYGEVWVQSSKWLPDFWKPSVGNSGIGSALGTWRSWWDKKLKPARIRKDCIARQLDENKIRQMHKKVWNRKVGISATHHQVEVIIRNLRATRGWRIGSCYLHPDAFQYFAQL